MNYYVPRCPHCNVELDYVEETYRHNDGDNYYESWEGCCPKCDTYFSWDEIYTFDRINNFEELPGP